MTRRRSPYVAPTRLDRMIAAVSPMAGLRRLQARNAYGAISALAGGYHGGHVDRRALKRMAATSGSADADLVPDLAKLREHSRHLGRNTPIAAAAINRAVTLTGSLRPNPQIDREPLGLDADPDRADAWERAAFREFALWGGSRNADAARVQCFDDLQQLAFRGTLESGDCFAVRGFTPRPGHPYGLNLQIFEGDQVSNPNGLRAGAPAETATPKGQSGNRLVAGIEIDPMGAAVAVFFQKDHPGTVKGLAQRTWTRVPVWSSDGKRLQIIHLYDRKRPGQTRGVPYLAPVIEQLQQLGTYSNAELMAAVIGAMIAVVYKNSSGDSLPENAEQEAAVTPATNDYRMEEGTIIEFDSDSEISVPQIGRPNREFDPFFVAIVRQIGAALEIPFEVLIMHFTASYSASRAALEMAAQFIRSRRKWLGTYFCSVVYGWLMEEAIATDRLAAPGFFADAGLHAAWLGVEWIGPGRISLDPQRENKADEIAEDRGWKTAGGITAERTGGDWERNIRQRGREESQRAANGAPRQAPGPAAGAAGRTVPSDDRPEDETEEDT